MSDNPNRYRCTYCGQFYSDRTKDKHRVCHMIEEEQTAEGYERKGGGMGSRVGGGDRLEDEYD